MAEIVIKKEREKAIIRRHPWIYSGAITRVIGSPKLGEPVTVVSEKGDFLAKAAYNPNSNIAGRIWTWDEGKAVNSDLFEERLLMAINSRRGLNELNHTNAMRLVHGESDGFPGMILDHYMDNLVVQFLTAGVEFWRKELIDLILNITRTKFLYERSDVDVRLLEGLPLAKGLIYGQMPKNAITIQENGVDFVVDIVDGHKTGWYLDQRDNRLLARAISVNRKVLDCFCYSGGFSINALLGGANHVMMVDSAANALAFAKQNLSINKINENRVEIFDQDVFKCLRALRDRGEAFDLIILDPPKFAPTISQVERATRAYKDINLLAIKLLKPGGLLLSFSCSGGVSAELFQKIVAGAAIDSNANVTILKRLDQASDHPVALNFPEGAYLKGFLLEKRS
jgi:23S rRNA (cytosine1962-C5)-methyltransferase